MQHSSAVQKLNGSTLELGHTNRIGRFFQRLSNEG